MFWLNIIGAAMLVFTAVMHFRAVKKRKALEPDATDSKLVRAGSSKVRRGPVPGYARYAADRVDASALNALAGAELPEWRPIYLEHFHAQNRERGWLRVAFDAANVQEVVQVMTRLAVAAQRVSGFSAIAIERELDDGTEGGILVYSPDRRGWHGGPLPAEVVGRFDEVGPMSARVVGAPVTPPRRLRQPEPVPDDLQTT